MAHWGGGLHYSAGEAHHPRSATAATWNTGQVWQPTHQGGSTVRSCYLQTSMATIGSSSRLISAEGQLCTVHYPTLMGITYILSQCQSTFLWSFFNFYFPTKHTCSDPFPFLYALTNSHQNQDKDNIFRCK